MPTLAEIESRQRLSAQGESRVLALGQESGKPLGKTGETWVTATSTSDARTLADWMAALASNANGAVYATLAAASAATPVTAPDGIRLLGYSVAGDGGAANYKKVSAEPSHEGKFSLVTSGGPTVWYEIDEPVYNELMFGAVSSRSSALQTAAINNMLAAAITTSPFKKCQIIRSHTITNTIVVGSGVVLEWAPSTNGGAAMIKGFNGDMLTLAGGSTLIRPHLNGAGGTYTGRGIVISDGMDQYLWEPLILLTEGYCLEFTASGAGARFRCVGGNMTRQTTTDSAIGMPASELSTIGFRHFYGTHGGGGALIDFKAGNYTMLDGCVGTSVTFNADSQRVIMRGCRIAAAATSVYGNQHVFDGNAFGGTVTLESGCSGNRFGPTNLHSGITDSSGNDSNHIWHDAIAFTPTWKGASSDPAIGDGTLTGFYRRAGNLVTASIRVVMGSTTTYGSGVWSFDIPVGDKTKFIASAAVHGFDSGTANRHGVATTNTANKQIIIVSDGGGNNWGALIPQTWATSDYLEFSITYEIDY